MNPEREKSIRKQAMDGMFAPYEDTELLLAEIDRLRAEVERQNTQLLAIAREIGETLPLHVQHRSAVDALRWFAAECKRLS